MRLHWFETLAITCTLMLSAGSALAEDIYRWVDENGTVHFDARPPAGVDAERVSSFSPAASSSESETDTPDSPFAVPGQPSPAQVAREERMKRAQEQREKKAEMEPQCEAMRQRVEEIEPHTRVIVQDDDGTVRRLEDQERMDLLAQAKDFIAKYCQ